MIGVFEKKLSLQFPGSDGLRRHRLSRCLRDRNYAAAAALFAHGSVEDREAFEYYDQLSKSFAETGEFDSPAVLRHLSERFPSRRRQALRACALHLEALGHRGRALTMLAESAASSADIHRRAIWLALDMLQRGRLLLDEEIDDDLVLRIVEWLARDLSRLPRDGYLRQRLSDLVSPEILGSTGLPAIAAMVLTFFRRPVTPER